MGKRTGRGRHVTVQGATFNGGAGGIRIRGDVDASVTASIEGEDGLRSAVEDLVEQLRAADDGELADAADELAEAVREEPVSPRRLRTLMRRIERHPAITGATAGLLAEAIRLAGGGG